MEPDPNARLITVVEAVAARAEEARRRLDDLAARMDELSDGRPPAPPSRPDPADPIRLAAIELAVSGSDRAETVALSWSFTRLTSLERSTFAVRILEGSPER